MRAAARYSDLDHVDTFKPANETTTANLMAVCRRHHRLKHDGHWTVTRNNTTGVTTWTDHRGRTYQSRPPDRPTTTGLVTPPQPRPCATAPEADLPPF